jgi:hypothetical protein
MLGLGFTNQASFTKRLQQKKESEQDSERLRRDQPKTETKKQDHPRTSNQVRSSIKISPRSRSSNERDNPPPESVSSTPKDTYFSIIKNLESSSIPPSSVADKSEPYQDEEEDYKSMWADISEHTVGKGSAVNE